MSSAIATARPSIAKPPRHRPTATPPKLLATFIVIRKWDDHILENSGFEARSEYVERFWLPTLGPTATWMLRRLARGLELCPAGVRINTEDTSKSVGLGGGTGRSAPLTKALDRLCSFGIARWSGDAELSCKTHIQALTDRQLGRLPIALQRTHQKWITQRNDETATARAMELARCLHALGDEPARIASQLNQWGFDPTLAHAATDVARMSDARSRRSAGFG